MTGPLGALERSLRDGPPDEGGYRPRPLDFMEVPSFDGDGSEHLTAARAIRRNLVGPSRIYLAAVVVVAIGLAAVGIANMRSRSGVVVPASALPTQVSPSPASPRPSPRSSDAAPGSVITIPRLTATFVSPRNGFSVRFPDGWTVTPATTRWRPDTFLAGGHPAVDMLVRPGEARFWVASQPLGSGQTENAWLGTFFQPYEGPKPCGGDRSSWPRLQIGGVSGYLDRIDCPAGVDGRISEPDVSFEALAFSGGRVYQIHLDGNVDLDYFKALLATVRLDPSRAVD